MEIPADFLSSLGTKLKNEEGTDSDLAEILVEHVLSATPSPDCVKKASQAITDLAEKRATAGEARDGE